MHVEKQGPQECVLATIAALTDRPLSEIRQRADTLTQTKSKEYQNFVSSKRDLNLYREVLTQLCKEIGIEPPYSYKHIGMLIREAPTGRREALQGKGAIFVVIKDWPGEGLSHLMPYENGVITDPANLQQYRGLEELFNINPDWILIEVKPLEYTSKEKP